MAGFSKASARYTRRLWRALCMIERFASVSDQPDFVRKVQASSDPAHSAALLQAVYAWRAGVIGEAFWQLFPELKP